jgi:hypothetical protein
VHSIYGSTESLQPPVYCTAAYGRSLTPTTVEDGYPEGHIRHATVGQGSRKHQGATHKAPAHNTEPAFGVAAYSIVWTSEGFAGSRVVTTENDVRGLGAAAGAAQVVPMSKFVDEEVGYSIDLPQVTTRCSPGRTHSREALVACKLWSDVADCELRATGWVSKLARWLPTGARGGFSRAK